MFHCLKKIQTDKKRCYFTNVGTQNQQQSILSELVSLWAARFESLPLPYKPFRFDQIIIRFNPLMRTRAGLCNGRQKLIELNPHLLQNTCDLETTLVHELCHLAVSNTWWRPEPHGAKWQKLMKHFGFSPERCHRIETPNL